MYAMAKESLHLVLYPFKKVNGIVCCIFNAVVQAKVNYKIIHHKLK